MVEGALNAAAEPIIEYTAYGRLLERDGNRCASAAPQGLYACRGEENWLALSVETDAQWQALTEVVARPGLGAGSRARYARPAPRAARPHRCVAARLGCGARPRERPWRSSWRAECRPQCSSTPASPSDHPQMVARGFYEQTPHPVVGTHPIPGVPFRYASRERWIRSPAPTMGQHNREILGDLLGLSEAGDLCGGGRGRDRKPPRGSVRDRDRRPLSRLESGYGSPEGVIDGQPLRPVPCDRRRHPHLGAARRVDVSSLEEMWRSGSPRCQGSRGEREGLLGDRGTICSRRRP